MKNENTSPLAIQKNGYTADRSEPFISVNGATFGINSGFPTTGLTGAQFTISLGDNTDYTWSTSEASWISVDQAGVVTFHEDPITSHPVIIYAAPKSTGSEPFEFEIKLKNWFFTEPTRTLFTWNGAHDYVDGLSGGYEIPSITQVYGDNIPAFVRHVGSLCTEWGYWPRGDGVEYYWTSTPLDGNPDTDEEFLIYLFRTYSPYPMTADVFNYGETSSLLCGVMSVKTLPPIPNPSDVTLTNLYTRQVGDVIATDVYPNGKMQIALFPSVNYSDGLMTDGVKQYLYENIKLYELDSSGVSTPVDWVLSDTANEFDHDINFLGTMDSDTSTGNVNGYRIPIYITVPADAEVRAHYWYAVLGENSTSKTSPTVINVNKFQVGTDSMELLYIDDQKGGVESGGYQKKAYLHSLKYSEAFKNHTLRRLTSWEGASVDVGTGDGQNNCRLINNVNDLDFGQAILVPIEETSDGRALHVFRNDSYPADQIKYIGYTPVCSGDGLEDMTIGGSDEYLAKLSPESIKRAWANGLPVIALQGSGYLNCKTRATYNYLHFSNLPSVFIDNFGNEVEFVLKCDTSHEGAYLTSVTPHHK